MRRAAIVSPVRTAVGAFGGSLRPVAVEQLAATVIKEILRRTGIDPARIDDVVFAQSYANGETPCIGRWAALQARAAHRGPRHAARPPLRRRPAGRGQRGDDGRRPARPTSWWPAASRA